MSFLIHVPRAKEVFLEMPGGSFQCNVIVRAKKWGHVVREAQTHNLITDLGLNRMGDHNGASMWGYVHAGTGTTPPAFGDTELANFLGSFGGGSHQAVPGVAPEWYTTNIWTRVSAVGAIVGNITELGFAPGAAQTSGLFARALILDGAGNPTVFPILADEQLEVVWAIRHYPNLTDVPAEVTVGPNTHETLTRPLNVANSGYWGLPDVAFSFVPFTRSTNVNAQRCTTGTSLVPPESTGAGGSSVTTYTSVSTAAYGNGNLYRDSSAQWAPTKGNIPVIGTVVSGFNSCTYQTTYDPPLSKTDAQTLVVGCRTSWGRK